MRLNPIEKLIATFYEQTKLAALNVYHCLVRYQLRKRYPSQYSFRWDWMSDKTPNFNKILKIFSAKQNIKLLEIGSFEGRSAIWFLENILTDPSSSITCIDPFSFHGQEPRFDHNILVSGQIEKVKKLKGKSVELFPQISDERFDIIYIDGSHIAVDVLMDAVYCWQLLAKGGVLIFDDYRLKQNQPEHLRPQIAIDLFLNLIGERIEILEKDYIVAIKKFSS